jgi:hypothetical protein
VPGVATGDRTGDSNMNIDVNEARSDNGGMCGHKRERSSSVASSNRSRSASSASPTSSQKHFNGAPFRNGTVPSGKPKASDYEDDVKRRLLETISIYETYIFTEDAYPSQETQITWAKQAWKWAFENLNAVERYRLSDRMTRMVQISL